MYVRFICFELINQRLRSLLNKDCDGQMVIRVYDKNNSLTKRTRDRLVRFVIKKERDEAIQHQANGQPLPEFT